MYSIRKSRLWRTCKNLLVDPFRRALFGLICCNKIPLFWCLEPNWGDALNPYFVRMISGKRVKKSLAAHCDCYMVVGSILANAHARATVWGSGFIKGDEILQNPPKAIFAVRGPLTRATFHRMGIPCPEVFGDPALLLPAFFNPEVIKKYKVGIIPHYTDFNHPWVQSQQKRKDVLVIDVKENLLDFVLAVKSCDVIISSSLHGLICADAYGVRNVWINLSDQIVGGSFKFRDYRLSISAGEPVAVQVTNHTSLDAVIAMAEFHELMIDLRKLLLACPFLAPEIKAEIEASPNSNGSLPSLTKFYLEHPHS